MNERPHVDYFDGLRIFAALCVIFMHTAAGPLRAGVNTDWHLLNVCTSLALTAVPLFFMVSGYYLRRDDMTNAQVHERMCLKVKRFGGLLLDWALFYLAWTLLRAYASDGVTGVRTALGEIFTIRHIF